MKRILPAALAGGFMAIAATALPTTAQAAPLPAAALANTQTKQVEHVRHRRSHRHRHYRHHRRWHPRRHYRRYYYRPYLYGAPRRYHRWHRHRHHRHHRHWRRWR